MTEERLGQNLKETIRYLRRYVKTDSVTTRLNRQSRVTSSKYIRKNNGIREKVKCSRWMPWLSEATKDVTSCDKPGLGANDP